MASTVELWTPPEDMLPAVTQAWRKFYSAALDKYGMTPTQYRLQYIGQKGRCAICRSARGIHPDDPKGKGSRRLGIDHNHATGAVRGLLCTGGDKTCNRIIGWLNQAQLRRAADYLERPPARALTVLAMKQARETGLTMAEQEAFMRRSVAWRCLS